MNVIEALKPSLCDCFSQCCCNLLPILCLCKLSQDDLAKLVSVSRQTISSIETDQFQSTGKRALVLCIALDKQFAESFFFVDTFELPEQIS